MDCVDRYDAGTSGRSSTEQGLRLRFDGFELDEADARLTRAGEPVPLAPKPFAVLCALARTPRRLLTKDALLDSVWGDRCVTEAVLKSSISELRAALQDDPKQPRLIETVPRCGYRFIAAVSEPRTPGRTPGVATSPRTGRAAPLERLRAAWQRAVAGRCQLVWIADDAGEGTTTLMEQFVAELGEAHFARGQCLEHRGAGEPYLPVLEALSALCRRDAAAVELVRAVAPSWLLHLPWLSTAVEREALRRELSRAGEGRMLREMAELLDRYAARRPLLLFTENLHWSDPWTVQLMDYMARRRGAMRILWLSAFRPAEIIAADHPLGSVRHELRLHRLCEEIVLDAPLDQGAPESAATHVSAFPAQETLLRRIPGTGAVQPL